MKPKLKMNKILFLARFIYRTWLLGKSHRRFSFVS